MRFQESTELVARIIEALGVATIVLGLLFSLGRAGKTLLAQGGGAAYGIVRGVFGRSILLGLQFLVAGDIIRTVAVQPSLENVVVLGLIVLIRTFLSVSLEVEIDGTLPWKRAPAEKPASPAP
jgi:uncharacterized membrane protein